MTIIGAAGLGSGFYALHTASGYITSGTFDSKYNHYYMVRFFLGLLSGLILAFFLKDLIGSQTPQANQTINIQQLGAGALALIGGYAAEAVAQILDRVSETLVALVSGSGKDKIDAAKQKADADATRKRTQQTAQLLTKLQAAAADPNPVAKIQTIASELTGSA